ncbi:NAD(P)/FAD-dependent oxidoreductase [Chloroflexota bacterium]
MTSGCEGYIIGIQTEEGRGSVRYEMIWKTPEFEAKDWAFHNQTASLRKAGVIMKLFEPGKIGTMEVKNRTVMAPMGITGMAEADGDWGARVREYYLARARGGTGLITTGLVFVSQEIELFAKYKFNLYLDSHFESLRKLVEGVHQHGAKLSVQLTAGFGRVIGARYQKLGSIPVSASATPCYFTPEVVARAITTQEAEELAKAFGTAAKRCQMAGADAVELHGHEGYLLDQFTSGLWNQRDDRYGGDREKRLTFAREAMAAIRDKAGKDFPVIYRIGIDHYLEGGRTVEESLWIVRKLEAMGVDALHVDAGCYETSWWPHPPTYQPPGCMVDMAEKVKSVVKIPIIAVGRLQYPDVAEKVLQEGKADFIAIGRGLLADPDWPNKVSEGKLEDIRPCIGDHTGCIAELVAGRITSCTVNPVCGHEQEWVLTPVKKKKRLLVVGGGPAGMEVARVAAIRGLEVTLWEKASRLGGNLWPASVPEFKKDLRDLINYQVTQLKKLPVAIELGQEATAESVIGSGIESVILTTGAMPEVLSIAGANGSNMITAADLLLRKGKVGKSVLVVGGGLIGCETAVYLAQDGCQVTVIEQLPDVLNNTPHANRDMLLKMMDGNKVQVLTNTLPVEIMAGEILVKHNGEDMTLPVESIVLATGMRPCDELQTALTGKINQLYAIGDCAKVGRIIDAIWQAFRVAREIEA